jgi:hypothetical protein
MIPYWSVLIFSILAAAETCYLVPDPNVKRNFTVCDPIQLTNSLTTTDIHNITAWYILPVNLTTGAFVLNMNFHSWTGEASDLTQVKAESRAVFLNYRLFDLYGTDYGTNNNQWPNVTYVKNSSQMTATIRAIPFLFFRLFVTYINDPPQDIGNVTAMIASAPLQLNIPMSQSLQTTIHAGEWSFASFNFGAWSSSQNLMSYVQTIVECDPEEGEVKEAKATPILVAVTSCQFAFMCGYPMQQMNNMKSTLTSALNPLGPNAGPVTYSIGYPQFYPQGPTEFLVIVGLYNNNTRTCRVTVDTYMMPIPLFSFGSRHNLTSDVFTLSPRRYQYFQVMLPGSFSYTTNETIYFRLVPKNVKVNSSSRLALFYREFPFSDAQDLVSAQWNLTQESADDSIEAAFLAFSPYQPFSIYNLGLEEGSFYLEISKDSDQGSTVLFWALISLLCFSVVTLLVTGVIAIRYYLGKKNSGYSEIR